MNRRLLVAVLAAVVLAGCGSSTPAKPSHHAVPVGVRESDVDLLNGALAGEQRGIAAYTAADPMLSGFAQHATGRFLGQELRHAGVLRLLITRLGGAPHGPDAGYNLGHPRTPRQVLSLLNALERSQIAVYLHAIPLVSSGRVRATIAAILADDGQHLVVLDVAERLRPPGGHVVQPRGATAKARNRAAHRLWRAQMRIVALGYAALRSLTGTAATATAETMLHAAERAVLIMLARRPVKVSRAVPTALVR